MELTDRLPLWAKAKVGDQALWRWIVFGLAFVGVLSILIILARWRRGQTEVHSIRENDRRMVMMVSVVLTAGFPGFLKDAINITGGHTKSLPRSLEQCFILRQHGALF